MPLNSITEEQLITFIQNNLLPPSTSSPIFDWEKKLLADGFAPEFKNINFNNVLKELHNVASPETVKRYFFKTEYLFNNIHFNNCTDIWCSEEAKFSGCLFQDCSSKGFESAQLRDCRFENVTFDSATLS